MIENAKPPTQRPTRVYAAVIGIVVTPHPRQRPDGGETTKDFSQRGLRRDHFPNRHQPRSKFSVTGLRNLSRTIVIFVENQRLIWQAANRLLQVAQVFRACWPIQIREFGVEFVNDFLEFHWATFTVLSLIR